MSLYERKLIFVIKIKNILTISGQKVIIIFMKVTFGKYGGRKLADNPYEHIRPTADIVKQAVFNKIMLKIEDARVLDLFCGTGALGIEALSRGAKEAVFVDKDKRSIQLTTANLKNLNINAKVVCADFLDGARMLKGSAFDVIFLDPPYKSGLYEKALLAIDKFNLLGENGLIVCEHEKGEKIDFSPFIEKETRRYGIKEVSYLQR